MTASRSFLRRPFRGYSSCLAGLGVYRVLFAGAFLVLGLPRYRWIASFPDSFFHPPPGPMRLFAGFPSAGFFYVLNFLLVGAAVCLLVGYRVRVASLVLPAALLVGNGWDYSFGQVSHDLLLIILIPPLLAVAGWERNLLPSPAPRRPQRHRSWPIALLALLIGLLFFSAAVPKVYGLWLDPGRQGFRYHLAMNHFVRERQTCWSGLVLGLDWPPAWKAVDGLTVAFEAGFLVACFSRRLMRVFCAAACFFHAGVYFLMHILYWSALVAYAVFIDWSGLLEKPWLRAAAAWWDGIAARVRWYHVLPISAALGAVYVWVGNPFLLVLALVPEGAGAVVSLLAVAVALVAVWRWSGRLIAHARSLVRTLRTRRRLHREMTRLRQAGSPAARSVAEALQVMLDPKLSAADTHRIGQIEAMRRDLAGCCEPLSFVDYGAGCPGESRSDADMDRGRSVTTTVAQACASSTPPLWCLLLFALVRQTRPRRCLELGTNLGISTAYLLAALQTDPEAELVTLEGSEAKAELARRRLRALGFERLRVVVGRFQDTLAHVLHDLGEVSFAFIDGHHDEAATLHYFQTIRGCAAHGAVFVFDDIDWSEGMRRAWQRIRQDPGVAVASDLGPFGIIVLNGGGAAP
jgi:predicted O-methyltransferase YrrM